MDTLIEILTGLAIGIFSGLAIYYFAFHVPSQARKEREAILKYNRMIERSNGIHEGLFGKSWDDERNATLANCVALADEIERLQARIDAALAIEGWYPEEYHIGDYERGGNDMRDEFHKALTSDPNA